MTIGCHLFFHWFTLSLQFHSALCSTSQYCKHKNSYKKTPVVEKGWNPGPQNADTANCKVCLKLPFVNVKYLADSGHDTEAKEVEH